MLLFGVLFFESFAAKNHFSLFAHLQFMKWAYIGLKSIKGFAKEVTIF